jgi:hypothetical protein
MPTPAMSEAHKPVVDVDSQRDLPNVGANKSRVSSVPTTAARLLSLRVLRARLLSSRSALGHRKYLAITKFAEPISISGGSTPAWQAGVLQDTSLHQNRAVDSLFASVRAFRQEDEILGLLGAVGILSKKCAPAFRARCATSHNFALPLFSMI